MYLAGDVDGSKVIASGQHHGPDHYIGVSEESLLNDLKGFQDRFAREMGAASDIIAWPYGFYNNMSISTARKAGFRYILTSDTGLYKSPGESTKIPRININEQKRLFDFQSSLGAM